MTLSTIASSGGWAGRAALLRLRRAALAGRSGRAALYSTGEPPDDGSGQTSRRLFGIIPEEKEPKKERLLGATDKPSDHGIGMFSKSKEDASGLVGTVASYKNFNHSFIADPRTAQRVVVLSDFIPPPIDRKDWLFGDPDVLFQDSDPQARTEASVFHARLEEAYNDTMRIRARTGVRKSLDEAPDDRARMVKPEKGDMSGLALQIHAMRPPFLGPGQPPILQAEEIDDLVRKLNTGFHTETLTAYLTQFGPASAFEAETDAAIRVEQERLVVRSRPSQTTVARTPWTVQTSSIVRGTTRKDLCRYIIRRVWRVRAAEDHDSVGELKVEMASWQADLLLADPTGTGSLADRIARHRHCSISVWKNITGMSKLRRTLFRITADELSAENAYEDLFAYLSLVRKMEAILPPVETVKRSGRLAAPAVTSPLRDYKMLSRLMEQSHVVAVDLFPLKPAEAEKWVKTQPCIGLRGSSTALHSFTRAAVLLLQSQSTSDPPVRPLFVVGEGGKSRQWLVPSNHAAEQLPLSDRPHSNEFHRLTSEIPTIQPKGRTGKPTKPDSSRVDAVRHLDNLPTAKADETVEEKYVSIGHVLVRPSSPVVGLSKLGSHKKKTAAPITETVSRLVDPEQVVSRGFGLANMNPVFVPTRRGFIRVADRLKPANPQQQAVNQRQVKAVYSPTPIYWMTRIVSNGKMENHQTAVYSTEYLEQPNIEILLDLPLETPIRHPDQPPTTDQTTDNTEPDGGVTVKSVSFVTRDDKVMLQIPSKSQDGQVVRRLHRPISLDPSDQTDDGRLGSALEFVSGPLPSPAALLSSPNVFFPFQLDLPGGKHELIDCSLIESFHSSVVLPEGQTETPAETDIKDVPPATSVLASLLSSSSSSPPPLPPTPSHNVLVSFVRTTPLLSPDFALQGGPQTPIIQLADRTSVVYPPKRNRDPNDDQSSSTTRRSGPISSRQPATYMSNTSIPGLTIDRAQYLTEPVEEIRLTYSALGWSATVPSDNVSSSTVSPSANTVGEESAPRCTPTGDDILAHTTALISTAFD